MPANLLVLALLSGYLFISFCHKFRFRAQMLDGYRLLFHSSFAGALLLGLARAIVCLLKLTPQFWQFRPFLTQFSDLPYLGTFVLSVVLSVAGAWGWNRFLNPDLERAKTIREHGDSLSLLMLEAANTDTMIAITLENRKWYAGYVFESPNLKPTEKFFSLVPILSGYRDKDSLAVRQMIDYSDKFSDGMIPDDFVVIIPLQSVRAANRFDPDFYEEYFSPSTAEP